MTLLEIAGIGAVAMVAVLLLGIVRERRAVANDEVELWSPAGSSEPQPEIFRPVLVAELPEVAARYLEWSIADGTPLCSAVRMRMSGRIRLGRKRPWMQLTCEEVLRAGAGFLWKARTLGPMRIAGYDRYLRGAAEMRWRVWGLIPVMGAQCADLSRSAFGRFVAERLLVPASLLPGTAVEWRQLNAHTAVLRILEGGKWQEMQLTLHPDGMPRKLLLSRWGNFETKSGQWQEIPYAVRFEGVLRSGGYTLPHEIRASWWAGTETELSVVELEIENAEFRA